jgi:hypothetical protein
LLIPRTDIREKLISEFVLPSKLNEFRAGSTKSGTLQSSEFKIRGNLQRECNPVVNMHTK